MALKDYHEGRSWHDWHADLILRKPAALEKARRQLGDGIGRTGWDSSSSRDSGRP